MYALNHSTTFLVLGCTTAHGVKKVPCGFVGQLQKEMADTYGAGSNR